MGLSKMLRSASARPTWLDVKDLQCCFRTSALSWRLKISNSASTILLCLDCQRPDVPLPHFRYVLTAKDLKFRFRSVFTAKDLKFHVRTFVLYWLLKMWSSASAFPLCLDWQRSEVPLSVLVLPGLPKMWSSASAFHLCMDFQRFAVSLLHFRSILTAKDLKIDFSIKTLPSLPNLGCSASALPFCLDCKRSVVSHFRSAFIPKDVNALLLCLDCQRSASSVPL